MAVSGSEYDGPEKIGIPLTTVGSAATLIGLCFLPYYFLKGVPDTPVLLEQDKKDLAKAFGCRTLEQASRVVNLSVPVILRRLSRPQDALALVDLFQRVDGTKVSEVLLSDGDPALDDRLDGTYDPVGYLQNRINALTPAHREHLTEMGITVGTADDVAGACECAAASFCGAPGVAPEGGLDWILGPRFRDDFNGPERLEWFRRNMGFLVTLGARFGGMLVAKSRNSKAESVDAVCVVMPPGRLIDSGDSWDNFVVGGSRYLYTLRHAGTPPFFDSSFGEAVRQRTLSGALDMGTLHKKLVPMAHWHVSIMAVRPEKQGRKLAKHLLAAVSAMADLDGSPCYLETVGQRNVAVYEKAGYQRVYEYVADVDDSELEPDFGRSPPLTLSLMLRSGKSAAAAPPPPLPAAVRQNGAACSHSPCKSTASQTSTTAGLTPVSLETAAGLTPASLERAADSVEVMLGDSEIGERTGDKVCACC
eukprot:TRINITY_DN59296_c0_g1_i1.p1 TRINITY_DN59296_c0_g1~~TRINITY_DN59296_c0_g1_i1.p1  ORF type:complete len:560 (-),score=74.69 TRINITY_DN59296_c0_g1_i1:191-1621(-)